MVALVGNYAGGQCMVMTKDYLGRIQALRFFAAFAVLVAHIQHEVAGRVMPGHPFKEFTLIDGGIGVDVFFFISGFIMYHVSHGNFGRRGAARDFAERRVLRVAPLYYTATLLLLLVGAVMADSIEGGRVGIGRVITSFLFLPFADATGSTAPILKLGWTLNYEFYFYAVFAVALAFRRTLGLLVLFGTISAVVVLTAVTQGLPTAINFWGNSIVLEFLGGVAVAIAYHRGARIPVSAGWTLIVGGILLILFLRGFRINAYLPRCLFNGLPAGLIVVGVTLAPLGQGRGRLMRWLEMGGDASYALYLFHPFAIRAATLVWHRLGGPPTPWPLILATVTAAVLMSLAVNVLVEKPLDRWIRHQLSGRRAPLVPAT